MRPVFLALALTLAGSSVSAASSEIPPPFRGEWRHALPACDTDGDDTFLMVGDNWFRFYASEGVVQSVKVHSPREVTITATVSGEDGRWTDDTRLRLSADGKSLADVTDGEVEPFTRVRCPGGEPGDIRVLDPAVDGFTASRPEDRREYRGPPIELPGPPPPRRPEPPKK